MADEGMEPSAFARAMQAEFDAALADLRREINRPWARDGVAPPPPPWYRRWRWAIRSKRHDARTRLARWIAPWLSDGWD